MFEENNKKKIILSVVSVLLLIIAVIGVTYAAYYYSFNGTKVNTISTENITLELLESEDNIITVNNALPMDDNTGKTQSEVFDFVVTSKTIRDMDMDYTITLERLAVDSTYTSLLDSQIKVYLEDENGNTLVNPTLVSDLDNYVLYSTYHTHNSSHEKVQSKYKLRAWIDYNVDSTSWDSATKLQYKFKIGLTGGEKGTYTLLGDVSKNSTIPNNVTVYNRPDLALSAWNRIAGSSRPYYIKHILDDNSRVSESYIVFIVSEELASANTGLRAGTYYLRGGVDELSLSSDNRVVYNDNIRILEKAYGSSTNYCRKYASDIHCYASGLNINVGANGQLDIRWGSSYSCNIEDDGLSYCER